MTRILLLTAALLVAGCSGSDGETCAQDTGTPGQTAEVTGVAKAADGAPLKDVQLTLVRCYTHDLLFRETEYQTSATTDEEGRFTFRVAGGEGHSCFTVHVSDGEHAMGLKLGVHRSGIEVPELRPWDGALSSASSGDGVRLSWSRLMDSHGYAPDSARAVLTVPASSDPFPIWVTSGALDGALELPARLLEDTTSVTAEVTLKENTCGSGTTFERTWSTDPVTLDLPAAPAIPVSRGASCSYFPGDRTFDDCPFTDGQFRWAKGALSSDEPESITFDLGAAKTFRHAVLRDLSMPYTQPDPESGEPLFDHQFELYASTDGADFTRIAGPIRVNDGVAAGCHRDPLSLAMTCYADLDLGEPVQARYVRLSVVQNTPKDHNGQGNPATVQSLAQLSLFE